MERSSCADDVYGVEGFGVDLRDVSEVLHLRKVFLCDASGEGFYFTCPQGRNSCVLRREKGAADAVEEAAERHVLLCLHADAP